MTGRTSRSPRTATRRTSRSSRPSRRVLRNTSISSSRRAEIDAAIRAASRVFVLATRWHRTHRLDFTGMIEANIDVTAISHELERGGAGYGADPVIDAAYAVCILASNIAYNIEETRYYSSIAANDIADLRDELESLGADVEALDRETELRPNAPAPPDEFDQIRARAADITAKAAEINETLDNFDYSAYQRAYDPDFDRYAREQLSEDLQGIVDDLARDTENPDSDLSWALFNAVHRLGVLAMTVRRVMDHASEDEASRALFQLSSGQRKIIKIYEEARRRRGF